MNAPELLRAGGWRLGHHEDGAAYWEHVERYGLSRWDTASALADELARVSAQRDLLQTHLDRALELLGEAAPALLEGASELRKVIARVTRAGEAHWLIKDFNALYRAAQQFCLTGSEERRYDLVGQVSRLRQAFDETEATRAEFAGRAP